MLTDEAVEASSASSVSSLSTRLVQGGVVELVVGADDIAGIGVVGTGRILLCSLVSKEVGSPKVRATYGINKALKLGEYCTT